MGLLDDAIREHLELKRRNGADPGEVAREQQDALDPVFPGKAPPPDGDAAFPAQDGDEDADQTQPAGIAPAPDPPREAPPEPGSDEVPPSSERTGIGQETVELDMQSVLDADAQTSVQASPAGSPFAGSERDAGASEPEAESLEWEMPGEGAGAHSESPPDRGRRWASEERWAREEPHEGPEEHPDVHTELPGQERLSFE
jgi:hypothetical protein